VMVLVWACGAAASSAVGMWTALGVTAVGLGAVAFVLEGRALRARLRPTAKAVFAGVAVGALMTLATYGLYRLLASRFSVVARDTARLYEKLDAPAHLWLSLVVVPVVVGEEVVWRGLVQGALAPRLGAGAAALAAAPLYAVAHAPVGSPMLILAALACGLVWGGLRAATAGLIAPLVAHLLWDEVVLFLSPLVGR
jgi:membrane protease YdiL (CAAX protease family)